MNIRQIALAILNKTEKNSGYTNIALDSAVKKYSVEGSDRALLTALVYGVTERKLSLDFCIDSLSDRSADEIDPETRNILRLGFYQLLFLDRIPDHAAVSETVALSHRKSSGFVNALLRSYIRKRDAGEDFPKYPSRDTEPEKYLSVKYSVCEGLSSALLNTYGLDRACSILEEMEKIAPITLTVNTLKITREDLIKRLAEKGFSATATKFSKSGIRLIAAPVSELSEFFSSGLCFVQDEASQICFEVLDAKPGELIVDVCSAPGSKSFGSAILMEGRGRIIASDLHASRLNLIKKSAESLGISEMIELFERDARHEVSSLSGKADRVLCDVPCSGYGVLSKKPELRYKDPSVSSPLPDIQLDILNTASGYVKNGGVLVYSTCTIFPEENTLNVERFLADHPEFSLEPFEICGELCNGMKTLLPDENGTDGFFISKMRRN